MSKIKPKTPLQQIAFNFDMFGDTEAKTHEIVPEKALVVEEKKAELIPEKKANPIVIDLIVEETIVTEKKKSTRGRMKLSDMAAGVDKIEVPDDETLFLKRYYSIGVVSEMFKVNHSLIRFWENEFDILKPKKNGKGDRLFRPEDVKNLKLIYHLLRERKYTIDGAKTFLKKSKTAEKKFEMIESMKSLKSFLLEIKAGL
jgi:DNA-binding transcriptional MerR regulator